MNDYFLHLCCSGDYIITTTHPTIKKKDDDKKYTATTTVKARDEAGNTTILVYSEPYPTPTQRYSITPVSINYNGATTILTNTLLQYKWTLGNTTLTPYKMFASYFQTTSTSTESHWRPKKNQTIIMTKSTDLNDEDTDDDCDNRATKIKLLGFVIPYFTTMQGQIIISY